MQAGTSSTTVSTLSYRQLLLVLFTASLLMHFSFAVEAHFVAITAAAIGCISLLINPQHRTLPLLAVAVAVVQNAIGYPELANHATLELFMGSSLFVLLAVERIRNKGQLLSAAALAHMIRTSAFVIYFLTGFHKLNWGFLDHDTTCANEMNLYLLRHFTPEDFVLPLTVTRLLQVGTLVAELVVPFGLLLIRTRQSAVVLLLLFHAWLCFLGFANFASLGLLFLTGSSITDQQLKRIRIIPLLRKYLAAVLVIGLSAFFICNLGGKRMQGTEPSLWLVGLAALFSPVLLYIGQQLFRGYNRKEQVLSKPGWRWVPAVCFLIWGTQCYWGLSNRATLTMYSNLITEAGRSNHLLINTNYTKLFRFEEDKALIRSVSPNLLPFTGEQYRQFSYPMVLLRKRAADWAAAIKGPVRLELEYNGALYVIEDLTNDPLLKKRWYDDYLFFRETPLHGLGGCYW
jgi:hypothetical protein